jgi:hypothetical protein
MFAVPVGAMNRVPVVQKAGPEQHPAPPGRAGYEGECFRRRVELQQEPASGGRFEGDTSLPQWDGV